MADVPKMAIDKVMFTLGVNQDNNRGEIFESVNALPDEVIAHRLAMIPIPTCPENSIVAPDDCPNCKDMAEEDRGCPLCPSFVHATFKAHLQTAMSHTELFVLET